MFPLDRFPVEQDGVRYHDDVAAELIDEWLAGDYSALGYPVVRVPVLSLQERLAFALERLCEQGLIKQLDGGDWPTAGYSVDGGQACPYGPEPSGRSLS